MKVYATRWALTQGIIAVEGRKVGEDTVEVEVEKRGRVQLKRPHWHESLDDALERAEYMRLGKLTSLAAAKIRYERMKFTLTPVETDNDDQGEAS